MIFSLAIYAPPSSQASRSAYKFALAALQEGHQVYRVFFYHDGTFLGNSQQVTPQDEKDLTSEWIELAEKYQLDLTVCIAAALKRGLLNKNEAERYDREAVTIAPPFYLSGLGQLLDATVQCDRLITFG